MATSSRKSHAKDLEPVERAHKAVDKTDADAMLAAAATALGRAAHTIAEETRRRSTEVTKVATKEVREHPVATTAIATAVIATIAGLVLAIRQAPRKLLR